MLIIDEPITNIINKKIFLKCLNIDCYNNKIEAYSVWIECLVIKYKKKHSNT